MNNPGLNKFNSIWNLNGSRNSFKSEPTDIYNNYDITFIEENGVLVARTAFHPSGAVGVIDFLGSDAELEFDFSLQSIAIDPNTAKGGAGTRFTFYNYNGTYPNKISAGPILRGKFKLGGVEAHFERNRSVTDDGYVCTYHGQLDVLVETILKAIADGNPISFSVLAFNGDESEGYTLTTPTPFEQNEDGSEDLDGNPTTDTVAELNAMTKNQLSDYADDNDIDIDGLTLKADILQAILDTL